LFPGDGIAARAGTLPNDLSRRYLFTFTEAAGDIRGTLRAGTPDGTELAPGTDFPVAGGAATQTQPVVLTSPGGDTTVMWVEESIDSSGDHISKLRQSQVWPGAPPSVDRALTRYATLRNIRRLRADPSGWLLWEEGERLMLASATGAGTLEPVAAPLPLPASQFIVGSDSVLLMNDGSGPAVFTLRAGQVERRAALAPPATENSATVAGDIVFWIGHEEGSPAWSLYMQRFADGPPGPVQMIPAGPVVPGQLSAATDARGRYFVAVPVLHWQEPELTVFALEAGVSPDPALQMRRASPDQLALAWTGSTLYPVERPRFQRSTDLENWSPVPASDVSPVPLFPDGLEWRIVYPPEPRYFIRLAAELVP
jgi:hypothetical protein